MSESHRQPLFNNDFNPVYAQDVLLKKLSNYQRNSPIESTKYTFTENGKRIKRMVQKWKDSERWYGEKGIRYYRGALLHSKPGMGKSALVLEIARTLDMPIVVVDLSGFENNEFVKQINEYNHVKGLMLFEDIDCHWKGRENLNKTMHGGLTFDCFINCLSGVQAVQNKYVFITTNNLDNLDSALTRDGRIDDIIELEPLNYDEKCRVAQVICEFNYEDLLISGANDSTAEFENRCIKRALDNHWNPTKYIIT